MNRCIIYVFSGTGNTLRVATYYKAYLSAQYETEIYRIHLEKQQMQSDCSDSHFVFPPPDNADLVGFGYPIHAFNAPEVFLSFVDQLPSVQKKEAFIFESSGEGLHMNDASSDTVMKSLTSKGYVVLTDRHFVMPYNMIARHCDAMVKQMTVYARALARVNAQEILCHKQERRTPHRVVHLVSLLFRVEWWYAKVQGPFMKVNMDKCIRCGKCIANCPLQNITFDNQEIKMGNNCSLCVRCSFGCPQNAISIGLLNNWKVNGAYDFTEIIADESLPFPFITKETKGIYAIYKEYYHELNAYLSKNNTSVLAEDFRA